MDVLGFFWEVWLAVFELVFAAFEAYVDIFWGWLF